MPPTRVGLLVTKEEANDKNARGSANWWCQCACGEIVKVAETSLVSRSTTSCGCLIHTPEYISWTAARQRCYNPKAFGFSSYGGRGIRVCERWDDFFLFLEDMGNRPEGYTLDRYPDHNGDYEPSNCRWANNTEQGQNKRSVKLSHEIVQIIRDSGMSSKDLARLFNVNQSTISRVKNFERWA